jgi:hypothetical protein
MLRSSTMKSPVILLLALSIESCGSTDFGGQGGLGQENPGKDTPSDPNSGDLMLTTTIDWSFQCKEQTSAVKQVENKFEVSGAGPHEITIANGTEALLHLSGSACGAGSIKRNVVFVIDVSGSMVSTGGIFSRPTDPMRDGTCERMKALSEVVDAIEKGGEAQFGLVTFEGSSTPRRRSSRFFTDPDELYADFRGTASSIESVICAGFDATNYDAGIQGAIDLFAENSESSGAREVYFISDGEPQPASANGKTRAAELRKSATIATVMVGGSTDVVLKNDIASKDKFGEPLHARAEYSSKLSEVLAKLTTNNLTEAVASLKTAGVSMEALNFLNRIRGLRFDFDAFKINTSDAQEGIAVELSYRDRFGKEHLDKGELKWKFE